MNRAALSLSLLLVTAPTAYAEGTRSLGVTVSPVGVFAVGAARGLATGYSANVGWSYVRGDSRFSVGGHISSCLLFTEATPLSLRFTPAPLSRWQPYVGLGVSLVVPHPGQDGLGQSDAPMRLGAELAAGLHVALTDQLFLEGQGRVQAFPFGGSPMSSRQVQVGAAYLGLGFRI